MTGENPFSILREFDRWFAREVETARLRLVFIEAWRFAEDGIYMEASNESFGIAPYDLT